MHAASGAAAKVKLAPFVKSYDSTLTNTLTQLSKSTLISEESTNTATDFQHYLTTCCSVRSVKLNF